MPMKGGDAMLDPGDLLFVRGRESSLVDDAIKEGEMVLDT
jgi:hypothetical protein